MPKRIMLSIPDQTIPADKQNHYEVFRRFFLSELRIASFNFESDEWQNEVLRKVSVTPLSREYSFDETMIGVTTKAATMQKLVDRPKSMKCDREWYDFAKQLILYMNGDQ